MLPRMADTPATDLTALREQRRALRLELDIARLEKLKQTQLLESCGDGGAPDWVSGWQDLFQQFQAGATVFSPISTPADRKWGRNWPILQNEVQLSLLRMPARILCATNSYADGIVRGLTSYVIENGFKYEVQSKGANTKAAQRDDADNPLVKDAQEVIDEFQDREEWSDLEAELFGLSRTDGEYFLRHFHDEDDLTYVREVYPEQVRQRDPKSTEWFFGIQCKPGDPQSVLKYSVDNLDDSGQYDIVDADDMVHCKINSLRGIKRGVTDFWGGTYKALVLAERLSNNAGDGAAEREAIAFFRTHETANLGQVSAFIETQKPNHGQHPQGIVDIPKGLKPEPPPNSGSEGSVAVLGALLQRAAQRWQAPAWLASADASATNYASSLTAESPFVRWVTRCQRYYRGRFLRTMCIVLGNAVIARRLPANTLDLVRVVAEPPRVEVRDTEQEARVDQIYVGMGAKPIQRISREQGWDYEQDMQDIAEHQAAFPPPESLQLPDDEGGGGAGGGGINPPVKSAKLPKPPKPPHPTTESLREEKEAGTSTGWVTLAGGTHVHLDADGNITKGPDHMLGKKPSELNHGIAKEHGDHDPRHDDAPKPSEHRVAAQKWVSSAPHLAPEQASEYTDNLEHALSKIPAGVKKHMDDALKHGGVKFHGDLKELRAEATKLNGKGAAGVVGFAHDRGMGTDVHLDGGEDAKGTYIHELWHAADNGGFHSDDKGWQAAYKKDILKGKHLLSRYAMTNASEGFAEFGRALAVHGEAAMAAKFPTCVKHLKAKGLL